MSGSRPLARPRPAPPVRHKVTWLEIQLAAGLSLCLAASVSYPFVMRRVGDASTASPIGGPFDLVDQAGRRVSDCDLRGKPSLIAFGFTACPMSARRR